MSSKEEIKVPSTLSVDDYLSRPRGKRDRHELRSKSDPPSPGMKLCNDAYDGSSDPTDKPDYGD